MTELLPPANAERVRSDYGSVVRPAWTADEIRALGTRTDLVTACRIVYGCGKTKAWELYHSGQLDFPALRCARRVVVPTRPLLELLHLDEAATAETSEAGAPTPATATTTAPQTTGANADATATRRHPSA